MADVVTVFGGTGFLGRRIVRSLLAVGATVRVAARHPDRAVFLETSGRLQRVIADVNDETLVRAAVEGAAAVANAVALYVERGDATFRAVHVDGGRRVAEPLRGRAPACCMSPASAARPMRARPTSVPAAAARTPCAPPATAPPSSDPA